MRKVLVFIVLTTLFYGGVLLANPDPANIVGETGDQVITVYPTGIYNSGTKAICLVPTPNPQVGDTITIFDGYQTVTFHFVSEAEAGEYPTDNKIPASDVAPYSIKSMAWVSMGRYCFRNSVKVIPTRTASSSSTWDFVHREHGAHPNGYAYVETNFGGVVRYYFDNGVDPVGGVKSGDGPNIQWAIDNVAEGGKVVLKAGTFNLGMENTSGRSKETLFIGTTYPGYGSPMVMRDGITLQGEGMDETILKGGGGLILNPDSDCNKVIAMNNFLNDPSTLAERDRTFPNVFRDLCIDGAMEFGMEVLGAETLEVSRVKIVNVGLGDYIPRADALWVETGGVIGGYSYPEPNLPKQVSNVFINDCVLVGTTSYIPGISFDISLAVNGELPGILDVSHNEVSSFLFAAYFNKLKEGDIRHNRFSATYRTLMVSQSSDVMVRSNNIHSNNGDVCIANGMSNYMTYQGNKLTGNPGVGIRFMNANDNVFRGNNLDGLEATSADAELQGTSSNNRLMGGGQATVIDNGLDNWFSGNWTVLIP